MRQVREGSNCSSLRRQRPPRSASFSIFLSGITHFCLVLAVPAAAKASYENIATVTNRQATIVSASERAHLYTRLQVRGGESNDQDDDDEERQRFWSLRAPFRLNADAQDEALNPPEKDAEEEEDSTMTMKPGNGRGGALAIHTTKKSNQRVLDTSRVATAASRMLEVDAELVEDDSEEEPEMEEIIESTSDDETDDETDDEAYPSTDQQIEDAETTTAPTEEATDEETPEADVPETEPNAPSTAEPTEANLANMSSELEIESESRLESPQDHVETELKSHVDDTAVPSTEELYSDIEDDIEELLTREGEQISEPKLEDGVEADREVTETPPMATEEEVSEVIDATSTLLDASATVGEESKQEPVSEEEPPAAVLQGPKSGETDISKEPSVVLSPLKPPQPRQDTATTRVPKPQPRPDISPFITSGYWNTIDKVASFGLSSTHPSLRISRQLRPLRKAAAHATGLHGLLSGKGKRPIAVLATPGMPGEEVETLNDQDLGLIRRRIAVIEQAREKVRRKAQDDDVVVMNRRGFFRRNRNAKAAAEKKIQPKGAPPLVSPAVKVQSPEELLEEQRRKERVKQIDKEITKGQKALLELQCEKDSLQRRPNPLYNYTTETSTAPGTAQYSRMFNFPPQELVDEYLDELCAHGRLVKLNHTHLWISGTGFDDDEEENIGDDLFTPSADARKLYEYNGKRREKRLNGGKRNGNGNGGGGSWLLRQSLGKGGRIGEKVGEAVETAAYKAVCQAVMQVLARSISAIHGVNVMTHSDIRLFMEDSPDLPPVGKHSLPGIENAKNYAQEAILDAMQRGSKKNRKRTTRSRRSRSDETFIQRDAVVETLISHCQISAPLLKLFPLAWQRALLGNIITLIAAVVSDFCDGIQLQILGHQLSFAFKPISEIDMIRQIGIAGGSNHRRTRPGEFEAAVAATAEDVSQDLKFLDRWHERALGSGMLRAQIANLIARIVLTLADEVLSGAQMDLWSAQAGGPRMVCGLEYRTSPRSATAQ